VRWLRDPNGDPRALLLVFADGSSSIVPVNNNSVFKVGEQAFSFERLTEIRLESRELAELELDVDTPVDLGRPVSEWGTTDVVAG
jgi:hypothetical protein